MSRARDHPCFDEFQNARRRVPKYLFRTSSARSGGGLRGLNTPDAVRPHQFRSGNSSTSIFDMTGQQIRLMASKHFGGDRSRVDSRQTEFSSWAASFMIAINLAKQKLRLGHSEIRIYVLDTSKVDNAIARADVFMLVGVVYRESYYLYDTGAYAHEYLVHGIVSGEEALCCLQYNDEVDTMVKNLFPDHQQPFNPLHASAESCLKPLRRGQIEVEEINKAIDIGSLFGNGFAVPVTAALLTLRSRRVNGDGELYVWPEVRRILRRLREVTEERRESRRQFLAGLTGSIVDKLPGFPPLLDIPRSWAATECIMRNDLIQTDSFPEVARYLALMRCLVDGDSGRGVHRPNPELDSVDE